MEKKRVEIYVYVEFFALAVSVAFNVADNLRAAAAFLLAGALVGLMRSRSG